MPRGGKRPGSGPPRKYKGKLKNLTISWPEEAIEEAKSLAKSEDMSLTALLMERTLGAKFLKNGEEQRPILVGIYGGSAEYVKNTPPGYALEIRQYNPKLFYPNETVYFDNEGEYQILVQI